MSMSINCRFSFILFSTDYNSRVIENLKLQGFAFVFILILYFVYVCSSQDNFQEPFLFPLCGSQGLIELWPSGFAASASTRGTISSALKLQILL